MDNRRLTKAFMSEFLEMYRSNPCLWKVKSKEYTNRFMKEKAYALLAEKWREVDADANKDMVVRKINSFRGCFRKELKRVEESKRSGAENLYKSKLWYFDKLMFLLDKDVPSGVPSEMPQIQNEDSNIIDHPEVEYFYKEETSQDSYYSENDESAYLNGTETPESTTSTKLHKKRHGENYEHLLNKVSVQLDKPSAQDEFSIVGINIANKLRKLPTETAIVVEKLLTDVLFEAQLGNINRYTKMNLVDSMEISSAARVIVKEDPLL